MADLIDPTTNRPLPAESIQRVLFIHNKVHVYQIPPLTSTKGFNAGPWTAPPRPTAKHIFTARIRIMETSIPNKTAAGGNTLKVDILLEDPSNGQLFAGAPYTAPAVVQAALDSARFFAVTVAGEGGMKATLGIGFEERAEAFDFGVTLADSRKVLGWEGASAPGGAANGSGKTAASGTKVAAGLGQDVKKDYSLKDGEKIHISLGKGLGARKPQPNSEQQTDAGADSKALFSIKPPPGSGGGFPQLAPPPSAAQVKAGRSPSPSKAEAADLGFDDGEFGEFQ